MVGLYHALINDVYVKLVYYFEQSELLRLTLTQCAYGCRD